MHTKYKVSENVTYTVLKSNIFDLKKIVLVPVRLPIGVKMHRIP